MSVEQNKQIVRRYLDGVVSWETSPSPRSLSRRH